MDLKFKREMSVLSLVFRGSPLSRSCNTTPSTAESIEMFLLFRLAAKYRTAPNERQFLIHTNFFFLCYLT